MKLTSLLDQGTYTLDWIQDFYTQAGEWWGEDPQASDVHSKRVKTVKRLYGNGIKDILELGAGTGVSAAALADAGYHVTTVELSTSRVEYAKRLAEIPRLGSLDIIKDDFYAVELKKCFDVVCCWETFGLGSDTDQRRLLKRIATEWLGPGDCLLMDVYSPVRPAREAGTERRLPPLRWIWGAVIFLSNRNKPSNMSN